MLLTDARREARIADGELVVLGEQDRAGWDRARLMEGNALAVAALEPGVLGQYVLMAAIGALLTAAPSTAETDWARIASLYDQLYALSPTPVVALNRAVAIAELDGPHVALALVDDLDLTGYHAWHATRADLLRRLGRSGRGARRLRRRDQRDGQPSRACLPRAPAGAAGLTAADCARG